MKNEGVRVVFRRSRAANSVAGGCVWRIIRLNEAFKGVLVTCKNKEETFKSEGARVVKKDLPCKSLSIFLTLKCS